MFTGAFHRAYNCINPAAFFRTTAQQIILISKLDVEEDFELIDFNLNEKNEKSGDVKAMSR